MNYGNSRTIMYIMLQQLIRQSLLYYVIIMMLRPDYEIDLIVFSYFMKCMSKNHFAFARHVDVNIFDLLNDREQNRIQEITIFANELIENENE